MRTITRHKMTSHSNNWFRYDLPFIFLLLLTVIRWYHIEYYNSKITTAHSVIRNTKKSLFMLYAGCWLSLPHLVSNWLNLYNSSTPTFFLWALQLHSFNPSTVKVIILIFLDRIHLLFTPVHFLFWQPGRIVSQYTTFRLSPILAVTRREEGLLRVYERMSPAVTKRQPLWLDWFTPTSNPTCLFGFPNAIFPWLQNYLFLYNIFLIIASARYIKTSVINFYFPTLVDKPWFFYYSYPVFPTLFWCEVFKPCYHQCTRVTFTRNYIYTQRFLTSPQLHQTK